MTVRPARRRILILGTVSAQGSLATHMVVPALPAIALDFGVADEVAQFTLTTYLVALAMGQVASGPIIDHRGRRPLLIAGGGLFAIGSLACWAAPGIAVLLAGRAVQAIGAACGLVAARAMVGAGRDAEGARDMALLTAIVMLSPIFAPVIGGAIALALGWHAIFALLLVVGALATGATAGWLGEAPQRARPARIDPIAGWRAVLAEPDFRRHLAIGTAMSVGMYAFLASAPFFLTHRFGVPEARLGLLFGVVASGAGGGALLASLLARRMTPRQLVRTGASVALAAAVTLAAVTFAGAGARAIVLAMALYALAGGLILPNALMIALAPTGDRVATAISLYGALQMAGSGLATMVAGGLAGSDPAVTAAVILAAALVAAGLCLAPANSGTACNEFDGADA